MKKTIVLMFVLLLALTLSACGNKEAPKPEADPNLFTGIAVQDDNLDDSLSPLPEADESDSGLQPIILTEEPEEKDPEAPIEEEEPDVSVEEDTLTASIGEEEPEGSDPALVMKGGEEAEPVVQSTGSGVVPNVPIKNYEYLEYTNEEMGFSCKYPSHWTVETSANTFTFTQPVATGIPMRLAISVKPYEGKLTGAQIKKEFTNYLTTIKDSYDKFAKGKFNSKQSFINRRAWACLYKAQAEGKNLNGYVTMTSIEESKQIVALHFSCSKKDYNKETQNMFKTLMYSVQRIMP